MVFDTTNNEIYITLFHTSLLVHAAWLVQVTPYLRYIASVLFFINQSQIQFYKINNITANYLQYTYHTTQNQIKLKEDRKKELYMIVFKID